MAQEFLAIKEYCRARYWMAQADEDQRACLMENRGLKGDPFNVMGVRCSREWALGQRSG